MLDQLKEWRERWDQGDSKFVPELFEQVQRYEKDLAKERDRNLGLILALEECKWKAEDVVERGYSEVSDAIAIIEIVKEHIENQ